MLHPTLGRWLVICFALFCLGMAFGSYVATAEPLAAWCGR